MTKICVPQHELGANNIAPLSQTIATCASLRTLDLSTNSLSRLADKQSELGRLADALGASTSLTDLNLNNNTLGPPGVRLVARALLSCTALQRLGFSRNEPAVEPALAELLRGHPSLTSIELVEKLPRHLPAKARDALGRALLENKAGKLGFLHCDVFSLGDSTDALVWP